MTRTDSKPALDRLSALDQIREQVFAGNYHNALVFAEGVSQHPAVMDYWRGICLTGLGADHAKEAKIILLRALGRGYAGAIGALAVADRLLDEPRGYLRDLQPDDYAAFDAFDRAAILREIGIYHEETDLLTAIAYLENAWKTAKTGPHGKLQVAFIGKVLGGMLKRRGSDFKAVSILTEALKHSNRTRRVPLLYQRCLANLELGRLDAVQSDLFEIKVFVPNDPELPPVVKYVEAQLARARGDDHLPLALALFKQAAALGQAAQTEAEFFAAFGACSVQLERGIITSVLKQKLAYETESTEVGAEAFHMQMLDLARTPRLRAFTALREALILAARFDPQAPEVALEAVSGFRALHHRREEAWALLTFAETHLSLNHGLANTQVVKALYEALEVACELGAVVVARELRLLPRVRAYLGEARTDSRFRLMIA